MNLKERVRNMTLKQKIEYYWEYYKVLLLFIAFVLFIIGNIIHTRITSKEYVLNGYFLNTSTRDENVAELKDDFLSEYPIDAKSEDIRLGTSLFYISEEDYQTLEVLNVKISVGEVDFVMAEQELMGRLIYNDYFVDLSNVLTEEMFQEYAPYFLYYDKGFAEGLNTLDLMAEKSLEVTFPDPTKPELMEEPIPIMIQIASENIYDIYPFEDMYYAFGFAVNGENHSKATEFLEYIMRN